MYETTIEVCFNSVFENLSFPITNQFLQTHMPYLAYVASEDIPARHEITIDYNPKAGLVKAGKKKAEKDMIRCLCRSERCRGFI